MASIRRSIRIDAPVEAVFEFVTHPENLVEIWPSLLAVKNVQHAEDGAQSFDWTYKMAGVKFRGHADTTAVEPNKREILHNESGIPATFSWSYQPTGRNETTVTLEVDYEIPGKILRALAEPFVARLNEREAETLLSNLKTRLELGLKAESGTHLELRRR